MKLAPKIAIGMILASLVPLLIVVIITTRDSVETAQELATSRAEGVLKTQAEKLEGYFESRLAEARAYASQPLIRTMDYRKILPYLKKEVERHDGAYEKFFVSAPSGFYFATSGSNPHVSGWHTSDNSSPAGVPKSLKFRAYWQYLIRDNKDNEHRSVISEPNISVSNGVKQVIACSTIHDDSGNVIGMLGASIPWSHTEQLMEGLREEMVGTFGASSRLMLVSQQGDFWYHWNPNHVVNLIEDADNPGERVVSRHNIAEAENPYIRETAPLMLAGKSGHLEMPAQGGEAESFLFYQPVPAAGYSLGAIVESDQVYQRANDLSRTIMMVVVVSVVVLVVASLFAANIIARPIARMASAATSVGEGKWQRVDELAARDELGSLSKAFNSMVDALEKRSNEIETLNHELEDRVEVRSAELRAVVEKLQHEVVERQRAELQAQTARDDAVAASHSKSTFLANMSHEIRTPLNGVLGLTQIMLDNSDLKEEQAENLKLIRSSGEHLLGIINDILELSRIEAGKVELHQEPTDLPQLVNSVDMMFRNAIEAKKLTFLVAIDRDVPPTLMLDAQKLRQVLANLLSNALKFTDQGSISLLVEATPLGSKRIELSFVVKDSGTGIAQEELALLFEQYQQTESGRKSQKGTGLGLAISKEYVHCMKGTIDVESEKGKGTTFTFKIPVKVVTDKETRIINTKVRTTSDLVGRLTRALSSSAVGSKGQEEEKSHLKKDLGAVDNTSRILLADDDPINRMIVTKQLGKVFANIREVVNGLDAVAVAKEWQPDVILMDRSMPEMDGNEATRKIRELKLEKEPIIIALTANAFEEDKQLALQSGADAFLSKPFKQQELLDIFVKFAEDPGRVHPAASP